MTWERKKPLDRGKPMDRGTPLQRGAPLQRGGELPRVPLQRSAPRPRERPAPKPRKAPIRSSAEAYTREVVGERSSGVCEMCGRARATNVHHLVLRSQGGEWCPSNCIHICGSGTTGCHGYATDRAADARAEGGWTRRRGEAGRPVLIVHRGWVFLDPDGGVRPAPPPSD